MRQVGNSRPTGERIAAARERKGWNASELARRMDVTPTAVWNWEKMEVLPRSATLRQLAHVLGVSEGYLLGDNDITTTNSARAQNGSEVSSATNSRSVAEIISDAKRDIARATSVPIERIRLNVEFDQ